MSTLLLLFRTCTPFLRSYQLKNTRTWRNLTTDLTTKWPFKNIHNVNMFILGFLSVHNTHIENKGIATTSPGMWEITVKIRRIRRSCEMYVVVLVVVCDWQRINMAGRHSLFNHASACALAAANIPACLPEWGYCATGDAGSARGAFQYDATSLLPLSSLPHPLSSIVSPSSC